MTTVGVCRGVAAGGCWEAAGCCAVVWQDAVRGCRPPATASIHSQTRAVRFQERRGRWVGLTKAGLPKRIGDKAKRALEWERASSRAFVTAYSRTRSRGGFRAFGAALRVNLTARGCTSPWRGNRGVDGRGGVREWLERGWSVGLRPPEAVRLEYIGVPFEYRSGVRPGGCGSAARRGDTRQPGFRQPISQSSSTWLSVTPQPAS